MLGGVVVVCVCGGGGRGPGGGSCRMEGACPGSLPVTLITLPGTLHLGGSGSFL